MRNEYIIDGDVVTIFLKNKKGEVFKTLIDLEDLDKVDKLNLSWHVRYAPNTKSYYAKATESYTNDEGKRKQRSVYLHIVIMGSDFSKGEQVDHLDHDTLNNRKYNLKIKNAITNATNRHGANRNNKSGVRNVSWISSQQVYRVQFQINGKNTKFGDFHNLVDAAKLANRLREKIYGNIYEA